MNAANEDTEKLDETVNENEVPVELIEKDDSKKVDREM